MVNSSTDSLIENSLTTFHKNPVGFEVELHDGRRGQVTSCYLAKNGRWVLRVRGVNRHVPMSQVMYVQTKIEVSVRSGVSRTWTLCAR